MQSRNVPPSHEAASEPESALIVLVPEAERLLAPFRRLHDPEAALPAHVTLLYPFLAPATIDGAVLTVLRTFFAGEPSFRTSFPRTGRFADVLYLEPDPPDRWLALIERLSARFPETPPYGGRFATTVPHLSVVHAASPDELDTVAEAFARTLADGLPLHTQVDAVTLADDADGRWQQRARFELRGGLVGV